MIVKYNDTLYTYVKHRGEYKLITEDKNKVFDNFTPFIGSYHYAIDILDDRLSDIVLPGWEVEEKCVSTKNISFTEVKLITVKYKYIKKDGIVLDEQLVEDEQLSSKTFEKLYNIFCYENMK